jgi:hypothetical protein
VSPFFFELVNEHLLQDRRVERIDSPVRRVDRPVREVGGEGVVGRNAGDDNAGGQCIKAGPRRGVVKPHDKGTAAAVGEAAEENPVLVDVVTPLDGRELGQEVGHTHPIEPGRAALAERQDDDPAILVRILLKTGVDLVHHVFCEEIGAADAPMQRHDRRMLPGRVITLRHVDVVRPSLAIRAGVREHLPSLLGVSRIAPSLVERPFDVHRVGSRGADGRDGRLTGGGIGGLEECLEPGIGFLGQASPGGQERHQDEQGRGARRVD